MNILFVCSRNKWRSATAETLYKNHPDHDVRSAGTASSARIKINAKLILWADVIFVMEKKHKQILTERFEDETLEKEIIILNIPDDYEYMDEELVEDIQSKMTAYL
ncbi:protein tyrosine phosphatase [Pedobacter sp. HDW13]|uniref:low molecular weight protein tyrosine phosphatase family protein n=1 Tax=unclassified Pedobacter TaxID=2628915 RepID=UPI000F5A9161|nr:MULTISPECIES: protein tyrosine phosphatase [unclassified Pedobacter]QIL39253.1 protein tyrosine phosphatase [Pedobacter sp. HDW13]RQO65656.1 protein tyrosine phosphatase [Pedobacter sp. KBW01]